MNIHEYQAKALLKSFGAPVAEGVLVRSLEDAADAAAKLPGPVWVVKAQIHAGGRGKGRFKERDAGDKGGVRIAISPDEVRLYVQQMLGKTLVTRQTGPAGKRVERIYVEDGAKIDRELYVSMLVDRANGRIAYIVSTEGGMDIEEVAHKTPEKIHTFHVDPAAGYKDYIGRNIAAALDLRKAQGMACIKLMGQLYKAFVDKDMSLLEVNPLVVLKDGSLRVLDAKVNFEDNALFRHKDDILPLKDESEEDEKEREAHKYDLSYVALDGDIGCMVNGAGLAMATMDIIKLYGGEPANFLDVGGGADAAKVTAAFKIITKDPNVKGILINIFGGIMKVDTIANGVIAAVKEVGLKVPLVVRLEGTNVKEGKAILNASGLDVIAADDLDDAARKIVAAVGKARAA